jgi:hypothetical protein
VTAWLVALAAGAVLVAVLFAVLSARRHATAGEARRVEELGRLAERLEASLGELCPPPPWRPPGSATGSRAPLVADRLPGRTALLDEVSGDVDHARSTGERLTAVLVRVAEESTPPELVDAIREVAGRPVFAVGPGAAAFTLPAVGRAGGLGVLARIESVTASSGRAVEWSPDESAIELVARLLENTSRGDG